MMRAGVRMKRKLWAVGSHRIQRAERAIDRAPLLLGAAARLCRRSSSEHALQGISLAPGALSLCVSRSAVDACCCGFLVGFSQSSYILMTYRVVGTRHQAVEAARLQHLLRSAGGPVVLRRLLQGGQQPMLLATLVP